MSEVFFYFSLVETRGYKMDRCFIRKPYVKKGIKVFKVPKIFNFAFELKSLISDVHSNSLREFGIMLFVTKKSLKILRGLL
jgi:hypothetical protein